MKDDFKITEGSDNVFADLGLSNPEERLVKADLAMKIAKGIRTRKLTQAKAATLFGIDQPKISRLLQGQLSGFSTEKLFYFLTRLGQDIRIIVKPAVARSYGVGHVSVAYA